jgi:predicted CXXCH cytochrome family protein
VALSTVIRGLFAAALAVEIGVSGLGPVPKAEQVSTHGPYAQGACEACHDRKDPKDPGPASPSDEACISCHDDFAGKASRVKTDKGRHPDGKGMKCVECHNPHNARKPKLVR